MMTHHTVRAIDHVVVGQSGRHILSIRFQPDGLSFAYAEGEQLLISTIDLPAGDPFEALSGMLNAGEWPEKDFSEVKVCIPTGMAVMIPADADRPESRETFIRSLGFAIDPDTRILSTLCPGDKTLLHAACQKIITPIQEKFGEKLSFYHPLSISLAQEETKGSVLRIDGDGGMANITLTTDGRLLAADVFPIENEASLLLLVNRIVVSNKIGTFRIICSGTNCEPHAAFLQRHYREVALHPDGEDRNLLSPFR